MTASVPIACLLRAAWPEHTAKHAARASGLSVRTAQGWMSERFTPSAATLLRMADRNDKLRAELVRRLMRPTDDQMAPGVLPVDGGASVAPGGATNGPRAGVASEG
jgi:hypothetical protein